MSISALNATITRNDLRQAVYERHPRLSRRMAKQVADDVFEEIILALIDNETVKLRGFGIFKIQHKKERPGRNPRSGKEAVVTARRSIKFVASPVLKEIMNGGAIDENADID
jgi:integration host factor subunit alpha